MVQCQSSGLSGRLHPAICSWMVLGMVILIAFPLLPIGNYSTLVYLFFYAPVLVLMAWRWREFRGLVREADRMLVALLLALLFWVTTTSLWASTDASPALALMKLLKRDLLILVFVAGICYLVCYAPNRLQTGFLIAAGIVAITGAASVIDQYILQDAPLSRRLSHIGFGNHKAPTNEVVSGIYFGSFVIIPAALLLFRSHSGAVTRGALAVCALASFCAMLLTGTRTALVALVVMGLTCLAFRGRPALTVIIGTAFAAVVIYGLVNESVWLHDYLLRGGPGSLRPEIWQASLHASADHLAFGAGIGQDLQLEVAREKWDIPQPHSHNFYLQLLNWTGMVGLSLYVAVLARALLLGFRFRTQPLAGAGFLILGYFAVVQVFDVHDVFTKPSYYWPCLWLPLGLLLGRSAADTATRPAARPALALTPS